MSIMARPIPRNLLIHEVTYSEKQADDRWGNDSFAEPVPIRFVRVDAETRFIRDANGEQIAIKALLFWDAVFSTPCAWQKGSEVKWNGQEMEVMGVDDLYDEAKLHHKEVRLV